MMKQWSQEYKKKILRQADLQEAVQNIRNEKKTVATLNGAFDLLHAGHLHIIFEASQAADTLIVGLNSDRSIKEYKGPDRPYISLEFRLQLIAALSFVDYVTWFDETDPRKILSLIKPDVHVNGADYGNDCLESDVVRSGGGNIHIVPLIPGLSTSDIVRKILKTPALPCV